MPSEDRILVITGTVQGVGFRPFVARLAALLGVCGWVRNDGDGVTIRARAPAPALDEFAARLRSEAPPAARIAAVTSIPVPENDPAAAVPGPGFAIMPSALPATQPTAAVTPDLALCDDCRRELADAGRPPPRVSLHQLHELRAALFDPARAALRPAAHDHGGLSPCAPPAGANTRTRRTGAITPSPTPARSADRRWNCRMPAGRALASRAEAIAAAAEALRAGRIVAVKGLGGFHLMVDAANEAAVRELRRRKHREEKAPGGDVPVARVAAGGGGAR